MLKFIDVSLGRIEVILVIILPIMVVLNATKRYSVGIIKVRIAVTSILCALWIIKIIPAIMLEKSIVGEVFFAILWAINTILNLGHLKKVKNETLCSEFKENKDVIDIDIIEEQDIDDKR